MVREADEFASEDEAQRKKIEALNSLSSFVYGLKTQLGDQEGLGGKISDDDKKTILSAVKETTDWIDDNGSSASVEDLEEKLAGALLPSIMFPLQNTYGDHLFLQRSKALLTPLPQNFTQEVTHRDLKTMRILSMMSCSNLYHT